MLLFLSGTAEAFPFFSRQVGRDCTYCHTILPKLNETGRTFRANGFRFEGEEWKEVRDWTHIPVSVELEVEAAYDKTRNSSGLRTESSDMIIEEAELMTGGAMGKTGKVSALTVISVKQSNAADGTSSYRTLIEEAFVQVNDLMGPVGQGVLNAKVGQDTFGFPFLSDRQKVIMERYFSESAMNIISRGQRVIELNGSLLTEEGSIAPTHRYSIGISRESTNDDDRLKGMYATYTATFFEDYSLGAIYRTGEERSGSIDIPYDKYGLAADVELGPVVVTAGYFKSNRSGATDQKNYMVEALYKPLPKFALGARFDRLKEAGKPGARSQTLMARYSILSNIYAQIELHGLKDKGSVAGTIEDEKGVKLFVTAIF